MKSLYKKSQNNKDITIYSTKEVGAILTIPIHMDNPVFSPNLDYIKEMFEKYEVENELNHQVDMLPIMSLNNDKKLEDIIKENLENQGKKVDEICDYDLNLYNREQAKNIGANDEFILAPRLDDLAGLFPAVHGLWSAVIIHMQYTLMQWQKVNLLIKCY